MTDLKEVVLSDGDDLGVVSDRHTGDDSDEPRREIANLSPGDVVQIGNVETKLHSVGKHVRGSHKHLYSLGIPPEAFGTVATLYVDRDPYRLDICNGNIYDIEPSNVAVLD